MLCAGVTTYAALRKSKVEPGGWVVIAGAGGGLGHIAVQLASRGMALRVIGIDVASKKDLVMDCGAEHFVDIMAHDDDKSIVEEVMQLTGGLGAHAVIVCSGSNKAYSQSLDLIRFNGTVVCVGMPVKPFLGLSCAKAPAVVRWKASRARYPFFMSPLPPSPC